MLGQRKEHSEHVTLTLGHTVTRCHISHMLSHAEAKINVSTYIITLNSVARNQIKQTDIFNMAALHV